MVNEERYKGNVIYLCGICNFGYATNETAKSCEDFCKEHNSCSMEITRNAVKK